MAKIHRVTLHDVDTGKPQRQYLVRAHTKAGAERFIQRKVAGFIEAKVPTQDELVTELTAGTPIEDATGLGLPEGHQPPPKSIAEQMYPDTTPAATQE